MQLMRTAIWNTAGYARLSIMETRDRKDSEALSNQKDLLCGYIGQKQDLKLCFQNSVQLCPLRVHGLLRLLAVLLKDPFELPEIFQLDLTHGIPAVFRYQAEYEMARQFLSIHTQGSEWREAV